MIHTYFDSTAKFSMTTATLISVIYNIRQEDLIKTVILAVLSATVSCLVSMLFKVLVRTKKK